MRRALALLMAAGLLAVVPAGAAGASSAQAPGCDVVSAELTWGFKESFRAYIDGSIANGEWTVADGATYETPTFGFPAGAGRIDPRDPNGSISFTGSVRFTGHGGILDTTIANPALIVRADGTGLLLLDVSGPTMDGDEVSVLAAPFLTVDLSGQNLIPVDGVIAIDEAPTTLTEEGAVAFPNYEVGSGFDPITVVADVGDCDLAGQPIGTDTKVDVTVEGMPWLALAVGALAVTAVAVVVALAVVRWRRP
ncbi:HtaA domain-containing protein [Pseudolysinimonas sp.]|uniref:HtaA domain-containing protein n=1 Tax=Pseudolysinimonas sp. TaxID=2680009 RepID=UPI00286C6552|nr:HtaA domain-containing protein [Pseudolysinimonas sp.]